MRLPRRSRPHYLKYKEAARALVRARLLALNAHYQAPVKKVFIKNLKSRWGSCSERGNLNFNYRILFLPLPVADYIIAHELCHLREFNHSPKFWALVAQTIPNYKDVRRALRALERQS